MNNFKEWHQANKPKFGYVSTLKITSIVGEADLSDEWSKGKSSPLIQVTSPMGNLDPYLPALPKYKTKNKPPIFFLLFSGYGVIKKLKKIIAFCKKYGNMHKKIT